MFDIVPQILFACAILLCVGIACELMAAYAPRITRWRREQRNAWRQLAKRADIRRRRLNKTRQFRAAGNIRVMGRRRYRRVCEFPVLES